jgi:hypothetical protein
MAIRLIGDRHGGVLDLSRPRVVEPQSLQLGGYVNLPRQRGMVADIGVVRRQVDPRRTHPHRNDVRSPSRRAIAPAVLRARR